MPSWGFRQSPYRPVRLREVVRWCWQPYQAQIHPQTIRVQSFTLIIRRGTFNAINSIRQVCMHKVTFFEEGSFIEEGHFHFGQSTNKSKLKRVSLFVFSITCPKQNARSLLKPVSDPPFYALSHSSKHFLPHGSSNNRLFQRF